MRTSNGSTFILTLDLEILSPQRDILEKRFEIGRQLHNALLHGAMKRYNEMIKRKDWRENQEQLKTIYEKHTDKDKRKELSKPYLEKRNQWIKEYQLSEEIFHKDIAPMQRHFKYHIDSFTAQKIASSVWKAMEKLLYGNGKKVKFKAYNQGLTSLEGISNQTGIRYHLEEHELSWNGLKIPVQAKLTLYEKKALESDIKYCRIIRTFIRGKYKYQLQLALKGTPPKKHTRKGRKVSGVIGIDIGTQTIAYVSKKEARLLELAPGVKDIERTKKKLLKKLDRSRRAMNPSYYDKDGMIIKTNKKRTWVKSKSYQRTQNQLKELYRKQALIRKREHLLLIHELLAQGNEVQVETMNYKGLQARVKQTTVNEKTGKFNKKKRFGKSLGNKAPSMFLTMLKQKLELNGGSYREINTYQVKASQYNHITKTYEKKELSKRWNKMNYKKKEIKVQRDLYSAFLIKNVNQDLCTINQEQCEKGFNQFLKYHNEEVIRLKTNIQSKAIRNVA